ncbi:MAG: hypothetical protein IPJ17_12150 [Holophagales bacterium]|nr:MAG: hypothetical protein IPJ17_12150 [Holophagales bacterium]
MGVDLPNGIAISYVVDADGRRIGKRVNGVLTKGWLYAGGLAPVAEVDALGQVTATFVYATKGNVPDYVLRDGTSYRLFADHLGSVRLVIEATTGALVQQIDYDAFGRITYDSNPGFQPFGFAGGLYDPQTGLTRFGARDYDPEVGRWTSKDPIGFAGGDSSLYGYVSGDPINSIDQFGLADCYEDRVVDGVRLGGPLPAGDNIRSCTPTLGRRFGDWLDSISPTPSDVPIGPGSTTTIGGFRSLLLIQIVVGLTEMALVELVSPSAAPMVNMGKQGKHILGHNNFIEGRSILTADPEALAARAGTGLPANNVPRGQAGFKERVDFGETIGIFIENGVATPTSNGLIIYAADGTIHIVPVRP